MQAQKIQFRRYGKEQFNAKITNKELDSFMKLSPPVKELLVKSAERLQISARSVHKIIKIARTIADLNLRVNIEEKDILEALSYREFIKK